VVFGKESFDLSLDLAELNGSNGWCSTGIDSDHQAVPVMQPDINGDG